uniref:Uncharacterized protein n=1 Tax=Arundo donax TaxID=35708 RepID=A0A0A9D424_ARUDO
MALSPFRHMRLRRKCRLTLFPQTLLDPSLCTSVACSMIPAMIPRVVTMRGKFSACLSTSNGIHTLCLLPVYLPSHCILGLISDDSISPIGVLVRLSGRTSRTTLSSTSQPTTRVRTMKTCNGQCSACAHWAGRHGVLGWWRPWYSAASR